MPVIKVHDCNCTGKTVDLEIENRDLKARNSQLEFDLAQANARINQLLNENQQLGDQLPTAISALGGKIDIVDSNVDDIKDNTLPRIEANTSVAATQSSLAKSNTDEIKVSLSDLQNTANNIFADTQDTKGMVDTIYADSHIIKQTVDDNNDKLATLLALLYDDYLTPQEAEAIVIDVFNQINQE